MPHWLFLLSDLSPQQGSPGEAGLGDTESSPPICRESLLAKGCLKFRRRLPGRLLQCNWPLPLSVFHGHLLADKRTFPAGNPRAVLSCHLPRQKKPFGLFHPLCPLLRDVLSARPTLREPEQRRGASTLKGMEGRVLRLRNSKRVRGLTSRNKGTTRQLFHKEHIVWIYYRMQLKKIF